MARYSAQDKKEYLTVCRRLRELRALGMADKDTQHEFLHLSIKAHALRGKVPKSWYSMASK